MNINHHPDDATLLAYAAGAVTEGFSLVIAAHSESCAECRSRVAEAEQFGGEMLCALQPEEMSADGFESVWQRIKCNPPIESPTIKKRNPHTGVPKVLADYLESDLDGLKWRSLVPGVRQHLIPGVTSGKGSVRLISIDPGVTIPHHTHGGGELTLVLRGSYSDEIGRFKSGDLADLDPSIEHQPVADTGEPCICLIATDERLRFSGMFSRMLQPLIGI